MTPRQIALILLAIWFIAIVPFLIAGIAGWAA